MTSGDGRPNKRGRGEIDAAAPYNRTVAAPDGSPSAASSAASPGRYYTLGSPPFTGATPPTACTSAPPRGLQSIAPRSCDPIRLSYRVGPPGQELRLAQTSDFPRLPRPCGPITSPGRAPRQPPEGGFASLT